jgi:hypothetical protein
MGVWGTGIFDDDTASDVRSSYTRYLGEDSRGHAATARVLNEFESVLDVPEEAGAVWLALAATQWQLGRLEDEVLACALEVIDSGSDLARWKEAGSEDVAKRKAALEKLKAKITSPQPPPKKVAKATVCECKLKRGDLVSFRLLSQKLIVFRVIGDFKDQGGVYPVLELLDWIGETVPPPSELKILGMKRSRPDYKHTITQIMLVGMNAKSASRIQELGLRTNPAQKSAGSSVVHWKYIDNFLKEWFLLE